MNDKIHNVLTIKTDDIDYECDAYIIIKVYRRDILLTTTIEKRGDNEIVLSIDKAKDLLSGIEKTISLAEDNN